MRLQLDPALGGARLPALDRAPRRGAEVEPLAGQFVLAGAAEDQQLVDDQREAVDLAHRRLDVGRRRVVATELFAERLEPQPQSGQRRPQLMGGVGDEVLLHPQQPLHPAGHLVEGEGQRALLAAALDGDGGVEVAAGNLAGDAVEAANRARDLGRDQAAGDQAEDEDDEGEAADVEDRGTDRAVDRVDALGDPHRAGNPALLGDRRRGRQDFGAEGFAVAGDLLFFARQRRRDLRPRGVVAPARGAGRVGQQAAFGVDDDHPAADAFGRQLGQPFELADPQRVDRVRGRGGDDLRLAARLAVDLGVDAVAQAQRQRHPEGDQRQRQHVGERQQEGGPEAYGSSPSGAAKRNPTPRTVSIKVGAVGSSPSLRRSQPTWTSSVLVEPNQLVSQTSDIRSSRLTT